jgi:hypothetical protein
VAQELPRRLLLLEDLGPPAGGDPQGTQWALRLRLDVLVPEVYPLRLERGVQMIEVSPQQDNILQPDTVNPQKWWADYRGDDDRLTDTY